jgi:formylglycine-generating enzyme required for sulfatase activity
MGRSGFLLACLCAALWSGAIRAGPADRVAIGNFAVDRGEVTIDQFRQYARARGLTTAAEREGGGFEFTAGWTRRAGWVWSTPLGEPTGDAAPAVHLSWNEARDFCAHIGGRLPTFEEWKKAAYTETRADPSDGFVRGRTYRYPVGDVPDGMNTSQSDPWRNFADTGKTRRGVNGLYDMGGNVWEWLADRRGDEALTAGGSWWYGPDKAEAEAAQWKPADFYAVYVGFRCAYDARN